MINSAKGSKDLGRGVVAYGVEVRNSVAKGRIEKDSGQVFWGSGMMGQKVARSSDHVLPKEGAKVNNRTEGSESWRRVLARREKN